MKSRAVDGVLLIAAALMCAVGAWAFWRYAGTDGFEVILIVTAVGLLVDNVKLRRDLRRARSAHVNRAE